MSVQAPELPFPNAVAQYPRLRQSILQNFSQCGLSAKWKVDHELGWSTHPQARGHIGHTTIAKTLGEMAHEGETLVPTDLMLEIFYDTLAQREIDDECERCAAPNPQGEHGILTCAECDHTWFTEVVALSAYEIAQLRIWLLKFAKDNEFAVDELAAIEERLDATVAYPNPAGGGEVERVITGRLDCLFIRDGGQWAIVPDWKFTWGLPPEGDGISEEGYFQQRAYALLVLRNYRGVDRVTLREFYVPYSEPREATIYREQLPDIEREFASLVERFDRTTERGLHRPSPGSWCSYCPRPSSCPIFPAEVRGVGEITTPEQARKAARELKVAEQAASARRKALKAWSKHHGDVPLAAAKGERVYGYKSRQRTSRPEREKLEAAIRVHGAEVDLDLLYRTTTQTVFDDHEPSEPVEPNAEDARLAEYLQASLDRIEAERDERQTDNR